MKKFGFKKDSGEDDSNRSALFGSRSKKTPVPSANPYAQPISAADPYTQAKLEAGIGSGRGGPIPSNAGNNAPLSTKGGYGGLSAGDSKHGGIGGGYGGDNKYGGASGQGYGPDKYGAPSGYGADKYGSSQGGSGLKGGGSRYGPGGYGGLGAPSGYDTNAADENRDALFGGASERHQQRSQPPNGYGAPPPYEQEGTSGAYGSGSTQGYGAYQDRQLTTEEEEEEDVQATKQQIRFMKQEDVSSTRNALRMAQEAEEVGRGTLARLGAQGEKIHNTEKNLDLAHNQNRLAEDKAKELKTLNKSMFAVHVSNPFTASQRRAQRDQDVIDKHREEKLQREATRLAEYNSSQRLQKTFKDLQGEGGRGGKPQGASLAERAKYQFEADSEDDEMENEIENNLDALSGVTGKLNGLARATNTELQAQNEHLDRIAAKVSISCV